MVLGRYTWVNGLLEIWLAQLLYIVFAETIVVTTTTIKLTMIVHTNIVAAIITVIIILPVLDITLGVLLSLPLSLS